jgi:hypothetical protein
MSVMIGSPLFLSSAGYQISRSVRLRANTGYLNRTFGASGSTSQWTYSVWTKRGTLGSFNVLLSSAISAATYVQSVLAFDSSDRLWYYQFSNAASYTVNVTSTAVFRDPSAWYHVVMKFDATTSSMIVWVNNQQVINSSSFSTTYRLINSNNAHYIGNYAYQTVDPGEYDGYMTEINFIDGQALTPASFGQTNGTTGVWEPIKYTGTYGTNGFYLNFSDNSAATATTIGKDYSGNGNNWTPNNISVTAGVTYDSMLDVPTQWADGGNGRGNYCTLNRLAEYGTIGQMGCNNGNLISSPGGSTTNKGFLVTTGINVGMTAYAEATFTTTAADNNGGVAVTPQGNANPGDTATSMRWMDGAVIRTNNVGTSYGSTLTANDVVMMAVNYESATSCKIWIGKNGTWFASGDPATGANPSVTLNPAAVTMFIASYHFGNGAVSNWTFGQRPFAYTPPTGFKALNTLNLPTPTILKGNQYFDATLWTGTGAILSVTNSGAMQPDLVWIKQRSAIRDHRLTDSVRGANKQLFSNTTGAETSNTDELTAFNSNGFTLSTSAGVNANAGTYVGWQWNAGGSTVTNTSGSISAQVRANPTAGFSVVTYTGNATSGATVGHGLGVAPSLILLKVRNAVARWVVYQKNVTTANNQFLELNSTAAVQTSGTNMWTVASIDGTTFGLGTNADTNGSTLTFVAYCFSAVAGYSAFGSYTGNGSADGPFVFLGFRPRWILTKAASGATGSWWLYDTARSTYNEMTDLLRPDLSNADTTQGFCDALSNGFKIRNSGNNTNGATYIYAAFAENPFKNALAR